MKKEINSKSRRKWIMGGLAAFASVALLTTGFAVWVVGVTQTRGDGEVSVGVDTAENKNVEFTITQGSDKSIFLGEPKEEKDGFVKTENFTDNQKEDFALSFSKFSISIGGNASYNKLKVSISVPTSTDDSTKFSASNKYVDNKVETLGTFLNSETTGTKKEEVEGRPSTDATYFELVSTEFTLPTQDTGTIQFFGSTLTRKDGDNGIVSYSLVDNANLTMFKWGTFFGGVSPCTFYNAMLKDAQTVENANNVTKELTAMYDKYNKKEQEKQPVVNLHFELVNEGGSN